MFEDSRVLAPMLFDVVGQVAERGIFPHEAMEMAMTSTGVDHGLRDRGI
jgi:hypothetical protein